MICWALPWFGRISNLVNECTLNINLKFILTVFIDVTMVVYELKFRKCVYIEK